MIRNVVNELAQQFGMQLLAKREGDPEALFRFRLPAMGAFLDLDEQILAVPRADAILDLLRRHLHVVQRTLFRGAMDHIAKFDRDPLDRVAKLETAARALLDALGPVEFHRTGDAIANAALTLEQLLRSKPGAASFTRDGYGKDLGR